MRSTSPMPRARHQEGRVELRGKQLKKWYGIFFLYIKDESGKEFRRKQVQILGLKSELAKFEAQDKLRNIILKAHGADNPKGDDQKTVKWFAESRYVPVREGNWRESTQHTTMQLFTNQIYPNIGALRLKDVDKVALQSLLNKLAKTYSGSVVKRVRICLKSLFDEAIDQGFLDRDPARKLVVPKITKKKDETVLAWEQLQSVLLCLEGADRLLVMVGMIDALRPGELFGLRWRSYMQSTFTISETVYMGKLRPYAKTPGSSGIVRIPEGLARRLNEWRLLTDHHGEDDFIFPNTAGGFQCEGNFLNRKLKPIRLKLHLKKLNFQVLRRSCATHAQKLGSVTDIQAHLRHAKPSTTAENYMKVLPESVTAMVEAFYTRLISDKIQ